MNGCFYGLADGVRCAEGEDADDKLSDDEIRLPPEGLVAWETLLEHRRNNQGSKRLEFPLAGPTGRWH